MEMQDDRRKVHTYTVSPDEAKKYIYNLKPPKPREGAKSQASPIHLTSNSSTRLFRVPIWTQETLA